MKLSDRAVERVVSKACKKVLLKAASAAVKHKTEKSAGIAGVGSSVFEKILPSGDKTPDIEDVEDFAYMMQFLDPYVDRSHQLTEDEKRAVMQDLEEVFSDPESKRRKGFASMFSTPFIAWLAKDMPEGKRPKAEDIINDPSMRKRRRKLIMLSTSPIEAAAIIAASEGDDRAIKVTANLIARQGDFLDLPNDDALRSFLLNRVYDQLLVFGVPEDEAKKHVERVAKELKNVE